MSTAAKPRGPVEEVMETLVGFIEEGLIGAIGLSGGRACHLFCAGPTRCIPSPPCNRIYHCGRRQPEMGMLQVCAELGTTFVAFSPVGRGIFRRPLSRQRGRFRPASSARRTPVSRSRTISANKTAIAPFQDWCRARGWSTSAVAVAWTLHRGDHVLPIPGARAAPPHIRELAQAAGDHPDPRRSCRDRNDPALGLRPWRALIPTPSGRAWNNTARRGERPASPTSKLPLHHHLLDLGDRPGRVQAFWGRSERSSMMV